MDLVTMILACSLYQNNSTVNAMIQSGSKNNPLTISVPDSNGQKTLRTYKTAEQAAQAATTYINQGQAIDIGLMQIPSDWLNKYPINIKELFLPCKNMFVATNILNQAAEQCNESQVIDAKSCTLSVYQSGSTIDGLDYASQVLEYADKHPFSKLKNANHPENNSKKMDKSKTTKGKSTTKSTLVDAATQKSHDVMPEPVDTPVRDNTMDIPALYNSADPPPTENTTDATLQPMEKSDSPTDETQTAQSND